MACNLENETPYIRDEKIMGFLFDTKHEAPYVNECQVCHNVFDSYRDAPDVVVCPECGAKGCDHMIVTAAKSAT